jgi:hypothetical protein
VKYELGFYIREDDILHSHSRETSNLTQKYVDILSEYITAAGDAAYIDRIVIAYLKQGQNVFICHMGRYRMLIQ